MQVECSGTEQQIATYRSVQRCMSCVCTVKGFVSLQPGNPLTCNGLEHQTESVSKIQEYMS